MAIEHRGWARCIAVDREQTNPRNRADGYVHFVPRMERTGSPIAHAEK
ncbi:hypothetical protein [Lysobacter sp. CA196]